MTILPLLLSAAFGGELIIEAKVPVRVALDGALVAEIYKEGRYVTMVEPGEHALVFTTGGNPTSRDIVAGDGAIVAVVGRTGITVDEAAKGSEPVATGTTDVRFRSADGARLMVQVGPQRVVVPPGPGLTLPLPVGEHPITIRNSAGTQIFARGMLKVSGGTDNVVQLGEGKLPEAAGEGVSFHAVGG